MFETDRKQPRLQRHAEIVFDGRPPNMNSRPGNWQAERRVRDAWLEADTAKAMLVRQRWQASHGEKWAPLRGCRVAVTFVVPDKRRRDWDNLIASTKTRFDSLVAAGLIVDDSVQVVEQVTFDVEIRTGKTAAIFVIDEVEDA